MKSSDGRDVQIPYSKVGPSGASGYLFADKNELQRYARDHAADPVSEGQVDKYLDAQPWWNPARLARDVFAGVGSGALKLATAGDRTPTTQGETQLQIAAATPNKGVVQGLGEAGENIGEFVGGGELADLVGGTLKGAAKYKQVAQVLQTLEQNPALAKVMRIGLSAVKNQHVETAGIAGAQTLAKTGSPEEAAKAGIVTGLTGPLLERAASALQGLRKMPLPTSGPAAEYAAEARAAAEPYLRDIEDLINRSRGAAPEVEAEPGTAIIPAPKVNEAAAESEGESALTSRPGPQTRTGTGRPALPGAEARTAPAAQEENPLDVDKILNTVHDFTGAADRLTEVNDAGYSALDRMTGGKFRKLNAEVAAAQKNVYKAEAGTAQRENAERAYEGKLVEMGSLMDSTKGLPEGTLQTLKNSWRQSYQLRDFGDMWDRNLNGIPGASKVSQEQRGVNGVGLMKDLQRAVRTYTRPAIEASLGPGRLENLENIARLNQTVAKRAGFNGGVREVVRDLEHGAVLGGVTGHLMGGDWSTGAAVGAGAMAVAPLAAKVLNAVKSNPRIGNYLTSAIEMGARPQVYAPIISKMIQDSYAEAEREKADEEHNQQGGSENAPGGNE